MMNKQLRLGAAVLAAFLFAQATSVHAGTQPQGFSGVIQEVDPTSRAAHVTVRAPDHNSLGCYSWGQLGGIIPAALAANSEIVQFRWSDATRIALIRKIRISASVTTTFFAAGVPVQLDLVKATGWTAVGTGGTRPAVAALLKKRTGGMGNSLLAANNIGIITTAALGAGTKTLEGVPLAAIVAAGPITASLNGTIIPPGTIMFEAEVGDGEYPLILGQDEGFVIRSVAVPATGTWQIAIQVDWCELSTY